MIVTRFALPVRSPMPLIVPCTCVAPASTAASVFATRAAGVVVAVDAERDAGQRFAHDAGDRRAICGGSEPPLVSHSTTRSAPASAAARRQSSA